MPTWMLPPVAAPISIALLLPLVHAQSCIQTAVTHQKRAPSATRFRFSCAEARRATAACGMGQHLSTVTCDVVEIVALPFQLCFTPPPAPPLPRHDVSAARKNPLVRPSLRRPSLKQRSLPTIVEVLEEAYREPCEPEECPAAQRQREHQHGHRIA